MRLGIISAILLTSIIQLSADSLNSHQEEKKVFICDSEGSTKYHLKKNCKGLEKCEHDILKLTKADAIKQGKTELCGYED